MKNILVYIKLKRQIYLDDYSVGIQRNTAWDWEQTFFPVVDITMDIATRV